MDDCRKTEYYGSAFGGLAFALLVCAHVAIAFVGTFALTLCNAGATATAAVGSCYSLIAMFAVVLSFNRKRKENLTLTIGVKKFDATYLIAAVLLCGGMFFGFGFVNTTVASIITNAGGSVSSASLSLDTPWQFVLFTVLLAVLPAVAEEGFFRGLLPDCTVCRGKISVVLTVSLCFALYHGSAAQLIYQFIYGVGLTVLTIRAKSTVPAMLSHFLNNFLVLLFEYAHISIDFYNPFAIAAGLLTLCGFIAFICAYRRDLQSNGTEQKQDGRGNFWLPYGVFGAAVYLVLIVVGAVGV